VKSERDNEKVSLLLKKLDEHARADVNLMPVILESAESYATLGEIADTMRNVFGEYAG
jgi:methylmalonyl-CoA mutase N-terminal domain/subunit